jgi:hypothetical protein
MLMRRGATCSIRAGHQRLILILTALAAVIAIVGLLAGER